MVKRTTAKPTFEIPMESRKLKIALISHPRIAANCPRIGVAFRVKNKPVNEKILLQISLWYGIISTTGKRITS